MALLEKEFKLIKELTSLNSISGYEGDVRKYLKEKYKSYGCSIIHDTLGGVFALKRSSDENAFTVLLDAHMDEVGFLTADKNEDGTINLLPVGGIVASKIIDAPLKIKIDKGFVGAKFISDENNEKFMAKLDEDIDVGFAKEVYFDQELTQIGENRYIAKAYDDRYGLALGLEILEHFKDKDLPFNLVVGGSTQEEVGLRGATTLLDLIHVELAIVLDCSTANNEDKGFGILDKGVLIRYFDRGMVAFKELLDLQIETCEKAKAPYQYFATMGGTNAGVIHKAKSGILTLTHCVCGKNIHTNKTEFSSIDYQAAKKSLIQLLSDLDNKVMDNLWSERR